MLKIVWWDLFPSQHDSDSEVFQENLKFYTLHYHTNNNDNEQHLTILEIPQ